MGELDVRGLELYGPEAAQFKQSEFFDVYYWANRVNVATQGRERVAHKLFMEFCIYDEHHVIDDDGTLYRRDTGAFVKHTNLTRESGDTATDYSCANHKEMR